MATVTLFSVPKAVTVTHHPAAHACMATWSRLDAPCFREAVTRGLAECARLGAKSWIVNLTAKDMGIPSRADLEWIESECLQVARDNGIVAVINVHGVAHDKTEDAERWNKLVSNGGLTTYDCSTVSDALALATEIFEGKVA